MNICSGQISHFQFIVRFPGGYCLNVMIQVYFLYMTEEMTDKRVFFLSDVHLAITEDDAELIKRARLYAFLEYVKDNGDILVINGDLFDFWYEWAHVIPKYWFGVIHKLRELIEQEVMVFLITGNHDFELGSYLTGEVGIYCFEESMDLKLGKKVFFIGHGDGLAKKDRGYRFMKRIIRNRFSKFLFKIFIHPDLGMKLAKWASGSSRKLVKIDKHMWSEEYFTFAKSKFSEGYDYVVLGHLHYPQREEENGKVYLNTGDWMTHFTYGYFDGTKLELRYWKDREEKV